MGSSFSSRSASSVLSVQSPIVDKEGGKRNTKSKDANNIKKKRDNEEWKERVVDFSSRLLDPGYMSLPVRSSTIEAAALYENPTDTSSSHKNENSVGGSLLPGTHKHLGGAYDPADGCIYGVPANARSVLCLYPTTTTSNSTDTTTASATSPTTATITYKMMTIPLPAQVADMRFKWLRGIFAHGYMWAIPSWADCVLCVDVDRFWGRRDNSNGGTGEDFVQLLPLPPEHFSGTNEKGGMQWQWHGAGINHEKTAIYCIPSNAQTVLKVDLLSKATSLLPVQYDAKEYPNFRITDTNKWYGGIVGNDNCVYGIPYRTCAVLQIDCTTDTARLVGPDFGCGQYNWHGGIQRHGKIYAHPSHADTVLVINTNGRGTDGKDDDDVTKQTDLTYLLPIQRAPYDTDPRTNYKWLGGSVGADGNIYCPACDVSSVLRIDTVTDTVTTFGYAGTSKNKWQGGILARDACVYCIPASGTHILRIYTHNDDDKMSNNRDQEDNESAERTRRPKNPIQLLGDLPTHKDKWQGGHVGLDGCLYFIPENGYRVLKVTPPLFPPTLNEAGELPTNDVQIEYM